MATMHLSRVVVLFLLGVLTYPAQATVCNSRTVTINVNSTKLIFNSPGFPNNYFRPLSCTWLFVAGNNEVINFRILTFDLFPSIFCFRDIFDIYDGKSSYSPVMQSWCGSRPSGQQYKTTGRRSLVTFQAVTEGQPRQGFEFEIWSEEKFSPKLGEAELAPVNLVMLAVFAMLGLLFLILIVALVVNTARKTEEEDRIRYQ